MLWRGIYISVSGACFPKQYVYVVCYSTYIWTVLLFLTTIFKLKAQYIVYCYEGEGMVTAWKQIGVMEGIYIESKDDIENISTPVPCVFPSDEYTHRHKRLYFWHLYELKRDTKERIHIPGTVINSKTLV